MNPAGRGPQSVTAEANPVAARDRGAEPVPAIGKSGHIVARYPADCLKFACLRIGIADRQGGLQRADIGLGFRAEHRIGLAVGRTVEGVLGEFVGQRALVPRVVALHGRRRAGPLNAHRLAYRIIGGGHITRQMYMRNVKGITDFVEAECLAIIGKLPPYLEPGSLKKVAQSVLILVAVKPSLRRAPLAQRHRAFASGQGRGQCREEGGPFGGGRVLRHLFGRHFSRLHALVHLDPAKQVFRRVPVRQQGGAQVQATLFY